MSIVDQPQTKRPLNCLNRWTLDPTTTMLGAAAEQFADPRSVQPPASGTIVYRVVVATPVNVIRSGKSYWQSSFPLSEAYVAGSGCVVALEGTFDQVGFPGEAVAISAQWPELWSKPTLMPSRSRGILVLDHERHELFETAIEVPTSSLPRWRPYITDYRRNREDKNE